MVEIGDVVLFMAEDGRYVRPAIVTTVWGAFCVNLRVINEPGDYGNQAEDYSHFVSSCTQCDGKLFPRSWIEKTNRTLPNPGTFVPPFVPSIDPNFYRPSVACAPAVVIPQFPVSEEVIPQPVAPPVPAEAATPASSGDAVEGAKSPA